MNTLRSAFLSLVAGSAIAFSGNVHAVTLVKWDLTGAPGNLPVAGVSFDPGVTTLNLDLGPDITPTIYANSVVAAQWTGGTVPANGDYFTFALLIDSESTFTLTSVQFSEQKPNSTTGPQTFLLQASFSANFSDPITIATENIPLNSDIRRWNFALGEEFSLLTDTSVYFRIYGYNRAGTGGASWALVENVTVTTVPEPHSYFLLAGGLMVLLWSRRMISKRC